MRTLAPSRLVALRTAPVSLRGPMWVDMASGGVCEASGRAAADAPHGAVLYGRLAWRRPLRCDIITVLILS